ncbi:MAG: DUF481 domain-containing protein [Deltaproteobacteria bacterium]|nr:MAG: DUF481 domain-containing protein [Deltaproteobacteria bacterium]
MLILLITLLGHAKSPGLQTTVKDAEEVEKPKSELAAEFGGALAAGNSAAYSLNAGFNGAHRWKQNRLTASFSGLFGQSVVDGDGDGILSPEDRARGYITNQQQLFGVARYDRFFGKKNSLYALSAILVDPFAGFTSRTQQQIGYSRKFVAEESTSVVGEVGFDWAQEYYVPGVDPRYQDIFALRFMVGVEHTFNEQVKLISGLEAYPNVIDIGQVRVINTTSLAAKLTDKIGFKTAYNLRFDNDPVPGFRRADHALTASLVVTFL